MHRPAPWQALAEFGQRVS